MGSLLAGSWVARDCNHGVNAYASVYVSETMR
jgi:hypothetical protein